MGEIDRRFLLRFGIRDEHSRSVLGENYVIDSFGQYSIEDGAIESIDSKPLMVVSDLDGTMVGDDVATSAFRHFWQRHRAVTHSTLVYNTGR